MNKKLQYVLFLVGATVLGVVGAIWLGSSLAAEGDDLIPLPTAVNHDNGKSIMDFAGPPSLTGDPSEYSIVYFTKDADDPIVSENSLITEISQARVASEWDQVLAYHNERPIEALMVHLSAFAAADTDWTAARVREGLAIVTIDMHVEESAILRGSSCDLARADAYINPYADSSSHYFLAVTFMISADNPADQAAVEEAAFNECKSSGTTSYGRGTHYHLTTEGTVMDLVNITMSHVDGIRDFRTKRENPHAEPTVAPELELSG